MKLRELFFVSQTNLLYIYIAHIMKRNQGAITGGHARPSAPLTLAEIFRHKYLGGGILRLIFSPFHAILSTFCFVLRRKKTQKSIPQGAGGSPNFFLPQILFLWLKIPCKISEPYDDPFWANSVFVVCVIALMWCYAQQLPMHTPKNAPLAMDLSRLVDRRLRTEIIEAHQPL